jgi:hypothetical protein
MSGIETRSAEDLYSGGGGFAESQGEYGSWEHISLPRTRAPKPSERSWISKTNAAKGDRYPTEGNMESLSRISLFLEH